MSTLASGSARSRCSCGRLVSWGADAPHLARLAAEPRRSQLWAELAGDRSRFVMNRVGRRSQDRRVLPSLSNQPCVCAARTREMMSAIWAGPISPAAAVAGGAPGSIDCAESPPNSLPVVRQWLPIPNPRLER